MELPSAKPQIPTLSSYRNRRCLIRDNRQSIQFTPAQRSPRNKPEGPPVLLSSPQTFRTRKKSVPFFQPHIKKLSLVNLPRFSSKTTSRLGSSFPMSPRDALRLYNRALSDDEIEEILKYKEIHFLGNYTINTPKKNQSTEYDDPKGFYKLYVGDHLDFRYEITGPLGKGEFGHVCSCFDHKTKENVAAKVIKSKKEYQSQALIEINLLEELNMQDPSNKCHIVRLKTYFLFRNHVVLVFELLGMSLYQHIKQQKSSIPLDFIQTVAKQMLVALKLMKKHKVIHCDLKPDNILLEDSVSPNCKIIDFGLGCFSKEKIHTYIQSRYYRAPEILLGISYSVAIDMWSFGCIIAELAMGSPLFPCSSEKALLSKIIQTLGNPPREVIRQAKKKRVLSYDHGTLLNETDGVLNFSEFGSLEVVLSAVNDKFFCNFISKCLEWNPVMRMTPSQALDHPFLSKKTTRFKINSPISLNQLI